MPNAHEQHAALLHSESHAEPQIGRTIELSLPDTGGGKTLMQALHKRRSSREFSNKPLQQEVVSNLLWAAFGVNSSAGGRTAPSTREWQEIDVYMANADGLYLYNATKHALSVVLAKDIRAETGMQSFVADAPVNLVYVADYSRMVEAEETDRILYSAADAGFISQNVCLFCASEGLATVVRGMVPRNELGKLMNLSPSQHAVLAQSVGYPTSAR